MQCDVDAISSQARTPISLQVIIYIIYTNYRRLPASQRAASDGTGLLGHDYGGRHSASQSHTHGGGGGGCRGGVANALPRRSKSQAKRAQARSVARLSRSNSAAGVSSDGVARAVDTAYKNDHGHSAPVYSGGNNALK
jgi:hypothetical protein